MFKSKYLFGRDELFSKNHCNLVKINESDWKEQPCPSSRHSEFNNLMGSYFQVRLCLVLFPCSCFLDCSSFNANIFRSGVLEVVLKSFQTWGLSFVSPEEMNFCLVCKLQLKSICKSVKLSVNIVNNYTTVTTLWWCDIFFKTYKSSKVADEPKTVMNI